MGNIKVFGEDHDEVAIEQLEDVASRAERAALMADGHRGYTMPIGGVAAYPGKVSVAGIGFDISCGNTALRLDTTLSDLVGFSREEAERNPYRAASNGVLNELADEIRNNISFGVGRANANDDAPTDDPLFRDDALWVIPNEGGYRDDLIERARDQIGTVGGGNHYVDVFVDEDDYLWVGVHFGSRGFGYTIARNFLALSAGERWGAKPPPGVEGLLDVENPIGHDYWGLRDVASRYATLGRSWVAETVGRIVGGEEVDRVENHHNDAWREEHFGREMIVVRKGATPAWPGQRGFVGGSMGDNAVILEGVRNVEGSAEEWQQRQALYSTVHGAGRVLGRRQAKRELDQEDVAEWLRGRGVIVRGGGIDEAPQAYKRLPEVIAAQGPTVRVVRDLRPLIVCMAPGNLNDPYKD